MKFYLYKGLSDLIVCLNYFDPSFSETDVRERDIQLTFSIAHIRRIKGQGENNTINEEASIVVEKKICLYFSRKNY